jgi:hypothetical protein
MVYVSPNSIPIVGFKMPGHSLNVKYPVKHRRVHEYHVAKKRRLAIDPRRTTCQSKIGTSVYTLYSLLQPFVLSMDVPNSPPKRSTTTVNVLVSEMQSSCADDDDGTVRRRSNQRKLVVVAIQAGPLDLWPTGPLVRLDMMNVACRCAMIWMIGG